MSQDRFGKLLALLRRLTDAKISHQVADYREEAVSVIIRASGEYWEVDFLDDGDVEVERFVSTGHIGDESVLAELFAKFSDEEAPATHDATART
jgi:hypothetical protein